MSEVRELIWNGTIPIKVTLAGNESRSPDKQEYLLTVPRNSYISIYLPQILAYFRPSLNDPHNADKHDWWFDFEGVPVRWNWPVGLSYDLLTGLDPTQAAEEKNDSHLPWALELHHKNYPKDYILGYESIDSLRDYWLNQSKEACYLRDGNAKAIMNMSKDETDELWESVKAHRFATFWSITDRRLLPNTATNLRYVPVKVYLPVTNKMLQRLIRPTLEDKREPQTVGTALHEHLTELFPSRRTCIRARPLIHGIVIPLQAPLAELLAQCMFVDGFLHVSIVMIS
ncbi:autophagy protein 5 [Trichomonascus vanleenenianus]|uniref:Atg5p n=1 Tax=Trichomonascus vanleenenianus TaxID=2268995 RepID=UPI003EC99D38